jgi:hypothetical protein
MQLSSPGDTTETCKPQCASTFCVQRPVLQTFVVQNPAVQTFCQAEACCAKCCFARQGMGLICRPATYAKSCCARTCCATQGMKWYAGGGRPNMLCTGRPVYCAWCHISVNMRMVCRRWQVTYATYWQACILSRMALPLSCAWWGLITAPAPADLPPSPPCSALKY